LIAASIGGVSVVAGLRAAYVFDTPAGPSIVCVAALLFATPGLVSWRNQRGT
jgi:zinc transport system permease protein